MDFDPKALESLPETPLATEEAASNIPLETPAVSSVEQHECVITNNSKNPLSHFPFSVDCSCGYHFDTYTIEGAAQVKSVHRGNTYGEHA